MKKVIEISIWCACIICLFMLLGFVKNGKKRLLCSGPEIRINHEAGDYFVENEDIISMISNLGYRVDSQLVCSVDIKQIERVLNNHPSIAGAEVYSSIDGTLNIDVKQRKPIIRVVNSNGESYYVDKDGWLMPLSSKYTSRVLIANGQINEPYAIRYKTNMATISTLDDSLSKENLLHDLYLLAKFIHEDEFWSAQVSQVYINREREIELIPRVGNHTIILGDIEDMEEKFIKLKIFYHKGLNKTGWNEYSLIDLKYKNQVVCRKK